MEFVTCKTKSDLVNLYARELAEGLRRGDFSVREVFDAYSFMVKNDVLNSFATDTTDRYSELVEGAEANIRGGRARALEGVPFASKALFCSKGDETNACSEALRGFTPDYDSFVLAQLKDKGGLMLGQTNMDELAMGSTTKNSICGPSINPWKHKGQDMIAGGSSGGAASAVAGFVAPFSLGSDTGGSARQPAALCGIVGVKPTYGLCSRWGMVAYGSSMDQAGVLTRDVKDAAWALGAIVGYDDRDSTSINRPAVDYLSVVTGDVKGLRVGILKSFYDGASKEVSDFYRKAVGLLKDRGAVVLEVDLPSIWYSIPTYYVLACVEGSSNFARYDGIRYGNTVELDGGVSLEDYYASVRRRCFGSEVKRRLLLGCYLSALESGTSSSLVKRATALRALIYKEFLAAFAGVDVVMSPTTSGGACAVSDEYDPVSVYYNDVYTVPANLCGCPAISVPFGFDDRGMPLGIQFMGRRFGEVEVFNAALAVEDEVAFKLPRQVVEG